MGKPVILPKLLSLLVPFMLLLIKPAQSSYAYSVQSCPSMYGRGGGGYGYGGYGGMGGYQQGGYGGGYGGWGVMVCGQPTFLYYYTCCDYDPTQCCAVLETWVIVLLVIIGILTLGCCLACCGACVWGYQRSRDN